jgi:hypothetical protein
VAGGEHATVVAANKREKRDITVRRAMPLLHHKAPEDTKAGLSPTHHQGRARIDRVAGGEADAVIRL